MQEHNLFKIFTERLKKVGAPYMISGSVASIIYGEPRVTHDIDIIITIPIQLLKNFTKIFPEEEFYIPPLDILIMEAQRENKGHCNIIHHESGFKADIYFAGNDEFQLWALRNSVLIDFFGDKIPIAPIEYVIVKKLEFYKEGNEQKHINDIKSMLKISKDIISFELLNTFLKQFNLEKEWNLCL